VCSVWLCHIPHSYTLLRRLAPSSVVCLSLCQSVALVSPAKMTETSKLPFAFWTRVGPMNHVLHEVQMPTWEGTILRGKQANQYRDTLRSSVKTRLNRSRCRLGCGLAWAQSIMCYMAHPDLPWERGILVDRHALYKVQALSTVSCGKTAEPIHLPFRLWTRVGRGMQKFNRICQVAPMCPHGRTRCRHLLSNIEPSVYGGDAPCDKLL